MYGAQNLIKVIDSFSMFRQPKFCIKMVALMLLLSTEATIEEKMNVCTDDTTPPTTEDHKSLKRIWIHASRHNTQQRGY